MKIIFLCGSLEPGRDGVGDYTRRLAGALIKQGHKAAAIALNDAHISEQYNDYQDAEGASLAIYRLPANLSVSQRFLLAKKYINQFDPTWLSLQFVPFAFHNKGLPFSLPNCLAELGNGRQWHIMFHELWVGMARNSSKKLLIWGWVQKQLIRSVIVKTSPLVIHSHTQIYVEQITRMGFKAFQLPLFSNIPTFNQGNEPGAVILNTSHQKIVSFVVFGTVHSGAPIDEFAKEAFLYSRNNKVEVILILIGRSGAEQLFWAQKWNAAGLEVRELGEQSPQKISEVLTQASVGVTNNPIYLVEKSGTVAAMREHGLPILCVAPKWIPRETTLLKPVPGVTEYKSGNLEAYINELSPYTCTTNLFEIAGIMLKSLTKENTTASIK